MFLMCAIQDAHISQESFQSLSLSLCLLLLESSYLFTPWLNSSGSSALQQHKKIRLAILTALQQWIIDIQVWWHIEKLDGNHQTYQLWAQ